MLRTKHKFIKIQIISITCNKDTGAYHRNQNIFIPGVPRRKHTTGCQNWFQAKEIGDIQLASNLRIRGKNLNNEDVKEKLN